MIVTAPSAEPELTYADYLHTSTLLSLQDTQTPEDSDHTLVLAEQFFIVAHQSCELWLKQVLGDLGAVTGLLERGDGAALELGLELLERAHELLRVLHEQVIVLERLPLRYFVAFRPYLGTASGVQSTQFHLIGRLLGSGAQRDGKLYQAFVDAAAGHGYSVSDVCRLGVEAGVLHRLAEALIDVGNGYWRWKIAHLALMSKMVGGQTGTGGSTGADFLARRTTLPFGTLRQLRGETHEHTAETPACPI